MEFRAGLNSCPEFQAVADPTANERYLTQLYALREENPGVKSTTFDGLSITFVDGISAEIERAERRVAGEQRKRRFFTPIELEGGV